MNIEHRTLNVQHRIMNSVNLKKAEQKPTPPKRLGRPGANLLFDSLRFVCIKIDKAWRHQYWTFDVGCSMFDVQSVHCIKKPCHFGVVSYEDRVSALKARNSETSYETTFQMLELVLSWATWYFVGWVEPTPGFVGFRCTQPNLHFACVIANCETQQR